MTSEKEARLWYAISFNRKTVKNIKAWLVALSLINVSSLLTVIKYSAALNVASWSVFLIWLPVYFLPLITFVYWVINKMKPSNKDINSNENNEAL